MTPRSVERNEWLHRWVWVLFDAAIWFAAIFGATWLRFDFKHAQLFTATTGTLRGTTWGSAIRAQTTSPPAVTMTVRLMSVVSSNEPRRWPTAYGPMTVPTQR